MRALYTLFAIALLTCICCTNKELDNTNDFSALQFSKNVLDFHLSPKDSLDKSGLMFSDQGAWFAFSLPNSNKNNGGFSGPFLMTQQNGIWSSFSLSETRVKNENGNLLVHWNKDITTSNSLASNLYTQYKNDSLEVSQTLTYLSAHTAVIYTTIKNTSNTPKQVQLEHSGTFYKNGLSIKKENQYLKIESTHTPAVGYIQFATEDASLQTKNQSFVWSTRTQQVLPNKTQKYAYTLSFIFPEYSWEDEQKEIKKLDFNTLIQTRKQEKNKALQSLFAFQKKQLLDSSYTQTLAKAYVTLQNNWRVAAGELPHEGLFPSYHYKWFHGFWAWDSWKHAVGLAFYNTELAKKQVNAMYHFQDSTGFIADCVFRDTRIEPHNLRDTKPPLSAWAVAAIYKQDQDLTFLKNIYPKLKKYHYWWYQYRDHDNDGLCEYGSTDGSLVAAKWESGMDNAIRFDNAKMLKNKTNAYSLDQESVDLNAYLYAEKTFLATLAKALQLEKDIVQYTKEQKELGEKIRTQFYDQEAGWFYDTSLDGSVFIKGEGSEGWIPLWANVASPEQAQKVRDKMMQPTTFFTKVPFQTMSADHPKFNPLHGYWRGPNWLDQAYFGVKGLQNYGYTTDALKATKTILDGAQGVLEKGPSIRENYHPITGEGLNAHNFSWSAAHIIMLLSEDLL